MDIFDYQEGIHPDCGKIYEVSNDIIITPFYTPEYCKVLVDFCRKHSDMFVVTGQAWDDPYSNHSMFFNHVSPLLFDAYVRHFLSRLDPIITEVFVWERNIEGFFAPFINRFNLNTQYDMGLHCEASRVSIVVKLNEEFEGGLLNFPRQKFTNKDLKVGEAVVFPGMVTHPHFVEPITSGERFSLVGFTTPPPWSVAHTIQIPKTSE